MAYKNGVLYFGDYPAEEWNKGLWWDEPVEKPEPPKEKLTLEGFIDVLKNTIERLKEEKENSMFPVRERDFKRGLISAYEFCVVNLESIAREEKDNE